MIWPVTSFKLFIVHLYTHGYILMTIGSVFFFGTRTFVYKLKKTGKVNSCLIYNSTVCYFNKVRYMFGITNWHYPELRGYFSLKSLLHSGLKQVMVTLGSARAVLVVALVYSFPDVFDVVKKVITSKFRFY